MAGSDVGGEPDGRGIAQAELTRRLLVAARSLASSSKRLERLTWVLALMTLALVGLTIALLVTQK